MTSNLHPDIAHLISSILRMPPALPCDNCGPAPCDHYPCDNADPGYGAPADLRLEALP